MENQNIQEKRELRERFTPVIIKLNELLNEAREQKIPVVLEIGEFEKRMIVQCTVFPRNHPNHVASVQDD